MLSHRLYAVLVLGLWSAASALSIGDRFKIRLTGEGHGSCGYIGASIMNDIVTECLELAEAGVKATEDFGSKDEATRLLNAFFKDGSKTLDESEVAQIKKAYTAVRDWLQKGGPVDGGDSNNKPWLFCHHTWLEKRPMDSVAHDDDGRDITVEGPDGVIRLIDMDEHPPYNEAFQKALEKHKGKATPYWSADMNSYLFEADYDDDDDNGGFCNVQGHHAAVQHQTPTSTLTLCPEGFGTDNEALSNGNVKKIRSVALKPKTLKAKRERKDQTLSDVLPTSTTMFHELFHLVLGNDDTTPEGGEIYWLSSIMRIGIKKAVMNPETYAMVAVAYDYTLHSEKNADGHKIEFFKGYTTQG